MPVKSSTVAGSYGDIGAIVDDRSSPRSRAEVKRELAATPAAYRSFASGEATAASSRSASMRSRAEVRSEAIAAVATASAQPNKPAVSAPADARTARRPSIELQGTHHDQQVTLRRRRPDHLRAAPSRHGASSATRRRRRAAPKCGPNRLPRVTAPIARSSTTVKRRCSRCSAPTALPAAPKSVREACGESRERLSALYLPPDRGIAPARAFLVNGRFEARGRYASRVSQPAASSHGSRSGRCAEGGDQEIEKGTRARRHVLARRHRRIDRRRQQVPLGQHALERVLEQRILDDERRQAGDAQPGQRGRIHRVDVGGAQRRPAQRQRARFRRRLVVAERAALEASARAGRSAPSRRGPCSSRGCCGRPRRSR